MKNHVTKNALIAKFMVPDQEANIRDHSRVIFAEPKNNQATWFLDELLYHKSWDWLMEVVEKIENLDSDDAIEYRMTHMYSVDITGNGTTIQPSIWSGDRWMIRHNSYNRRLQNTYSAIVEFINFYNLHKVSLWSKKM